MTSFIHYTKWYLLSLCVADLTKHRIVLISSFDHSFCHMFPIPLPAETHVASHSTVILTFFLTLDLKKTKY